MCLILYFPVVPVWNKHFMVTLLTLWVPVILLKYSKHITLTDFGLNINVKVLNDADRGTKYEVLPPVKMH